jgi:hypothetical protein
LRGAFTFLSVPAVVLQSKALLPARFRCRCNR